MNFELKTKIEDVYKISHETWDRLSDYFWNIWFILENKDMWLLSWNITQKQLDEIKKEFSIVAKKILETNTNDIILKLTENKTNWVWTNTNIKLINKIFG